MNALPLWLRLLVIPALLCVCYGGPAPAAAQAAGNVCSKLVDEVGYPLTLTPDPKHLLKCKKWIVSHPSDHRAVVILSELSARDGDIVEAAVLLDPLVQQRNPRALATIDFVRVLFNRLGSDPAQAELALRIAGGLEAAGARGNATALALVGQFFTDSGGGLRDLARAQRAIDRASEMDGVFAQLAKAQLLLASGREIGPDAASAVAVLATEEGAGNALATIALGDLYHAGEHVAKDQVRAEAQYRKAAALGSGVALQRLGSMIGNGEIGQSDWDAASALHQRAAEAGNPEGAYSLAFAFASGLGRPIDLDGAAVWYRRAGLKSPGRWGDEYPRFALRHGRSGDSKELLGMLTDAAERGNPSAISALAYPSARLVALGADPADEHWRQAIAATRDGKRLNRLANALAEPILSAADPKLILSIVRGGTKTPVGDSVITELDFLIKHDLFGVAFDRYLEVSGWDPLVKQQRAVPESLTFQFGQAMDGIYGWQRANKPENIARLEAMAETGLYGAAQALLWRYSDPRDPFFDQAKGRHFGDLAARLSPGNGGALRAAIQLSRQPGDPMALTELARAVEAGANLEWVGELAAERLVADGKNADYEAILGLIERAPVGPSSAGYTLAVMQWDGLGVPRNRAAALDSLHELALRGVGRAVVRLGDHYAVGAGVEQSGVLARQLYLFDFERVPTGVSSVALARLATLGIGQEPSLLETRRWLTEAAKRLQPRAQAWLDMCKPSNNLDCFRAIREFVAFPFAADSDRSVVDIVQRAERDRSALAALPSNQRPSQQHAKLVLRLGLAYVWLQRPDDYLSVGLETLAIESQFLRTFLGGVDSFKYNTGLSCTNSGLASGMQALGEFDQAIYFAKQAVNHLQRARRQLTGLDVKLHECFLQTNSDRYRYLADLYIREGRFAEAERTLALLKDFEHSEYLRGAAGAEGSAEIALTPSEAVLAQRYAQAFALFQAGGQNETAREVLVQANSSFREALAAITQQAALADTTDQRTAGALDRSDVVRGIKTRLIADMRARFDGKTVALHSVVLPDKLHWIVTTTGYQQAITIDVSQTELRALVGGYRAELLSSTFSTTQTVSEAQRVYDKLFAPVDAVLREVGAERVMMSLDDVLRYLPIAALHDGKDFLVRRYAFDVFRDMSDFREGAAISKSARLAAFGTSLAQKGFSALPAVPDELRSLVINDTGLGFLNGEIRLDEAFDQKSLGAAVAGNFEVVHVASHFTLAPDSAAKSVLLLGDGQLLSLNDWVTDGGLTFLNTKLLALSACQTGLGGKGADGREVDSLAVIAQDAGVPAVLASLWSVGDESTAELMRVFYSSWVEQGMDKAKAMQAAQLALLDGPNSEFADPFHWAPFFVMGDWR